MKMNEFVIPTPGGLAKCALPVLGLNIPEMDRFFERVARAVLYDAHKINFFAGKVGWCPIDGTPNIFSSPENISVSKRAVLDVFEYRTSPPFSNGVYLALVTFYKVRSFIVRVQSIEI
ncbi:MAG: hypothetical protein K9N10_22820 [Deltaproteobacteria bacterium]|nr:hypothetical protein [Deltaproteobacteria bacterium]